jgi:hypothetical protein
VTDAAGGMHGFPAALTSCVGRAALNWSWFQHSLARLLVYSPRLRPSTTSLPATANRPAEDRHGLAHAFGTAARTRTPRTAYSRIGQDKPLTTYALVRG